MPIDVTETDSMDCDPYWCKQLTEAVLTRQGKLNKISEEDRIERIQECLCEGAKIDTIDEDGNTALHLAVQKGYSKIVKFLVKQEAKTDIRNNNGDTALTLAKVGGKEDILNALKEPANRGSQLPSHQTASTSRGTLSSDERVYISVDNRTVLEDAGKSYKRKTTTDNEDDENVKKQRLRTSSSGKDLQSQNETDNTKIDVLRNSLPADGNNIRTYAARQGLKNSFHGGIYQVKLLMLFAKRGLRESYRFWLATEMAKAGKFDDLVFRYEIKPNNESKTVYRFLQAKHGQKEKKKISADDLLTGKDDDFSLQKYFISYGKMKKDSELNGSTFENFIICTNIDFDYDTLRSAKIDLVEVTDHDVFLKFGVTQKTPKRYRFSVDEHSKLYEILRQTADVYRLAKILAEHVYESKKIILNNDLFKLYHIALAREVIDVEYGIFRGNFIDGAEDLSDRGKILRQIFYAEAEKRFTKVLAIETKQLEKGSKKLKMKRRKLETDRKDKRPSEYSIWEELRKKPMDISLRFGQQFEPCDDPTLNPLGEFCEELVKLINSADENNLVTVDGTEYSKDAIAKSSIIFVDNIDKLAGHVLTIKDGKITFHYEFFNKTNLPGNLKDFRDQLKAQLGDEYKYLDKYRFQMPANFQTFMELLNAKLELPGVVVDKEDIDDFIAKLIFAVNQPDENELGDILIKEIGADPQFNLSDADLLGAAFEKEILDWFKRKGKVKGEEGTWYSNEDAQDFFDSLELKVNTLVCIGLSSPYTKELNDYGINFATENKYLMDYLTHDTSKSVLNLIATGETLPTAIRVHQAILKSGRYDRNDSLLFLRHGTAVSHCNEIHLALTSPDCHHLLVIDCESAEMSSQQGFYEELYGKILKNPFKKLIFITLGTRFSVNVAKIPLEICLNDLTAESRNQLMRKDVINFQGQRRSTSFGRLLGIRDCDENVATKLINSGELIDTSTLVKLIRGVDIEVGTDLRGLEETEKYYIPRRINQQVIIKDDVLQSDLGSDLVAISAAAGGSSVSLINRVKRVRFEDTDPRKQDLHGLIVLDPDQETEQFETLCNNSVRNVHLLKIMRKKLIWKRTRGNVTTLVKYRDVSGSHRSTAHGIDETTVTTWTEDQLVNHIERQKVLIISEIPGMGKSTVFTHLAQMIKRKKPGWWVIRIDLNDYTNDLNEERKSPSFDGSDTDGAVEFFVNKLSKLDTDFEKKVLKTMIKNRNEMALLFDGFDEISPGYANIVIDLLQGLEKIGTAKLLVSTRPHMREILENKLGTFAYTMVPFMEENQTEFLVGFWKAELNLHDQVQRIEQRLETYAKALNKQMANSVDGWIGELAGIPLLTRMIAEIFQNNEEGNLKKAGMETCEEFLLSENDEPKFPQKMKIFNLYKLFVEKKYYEYSTKKKKDEATNQGVEEDSEVLSEAFLERHEKLALHTLFVDECFLDNSGEPVLPLLLNQQEKSNIDKYLQKVTKGSERTGIINQVINGRSQFIHRTFAEYFVASFIINTLLPQIGHNSNARKFVFRQILLDRNNQYKAIRGFLNDQFPEKPAWPDASVLQACKEDLEACHCQRNGTDENYDTIFHKLADEGHFKIVKWLLNLIDQNDQRRKYWINVRNQKFGRTLVHIAAENQQWDELKWLIEKERVDVNSSDRSGRMPLHFAATHGKLDAVIWLVEKGAQVDALSEHDMTPLHYAAQTGSIPVVKWLMEEKLVSLEVKNEKEQTVLLVAASSRRWDLVKWLVEKKLVNVHAKDNNNRSLLDIANSFGLWDMFQYLGNFHVADDHVRSNSGRTVLESTMSSGSLAIIKLIHNQQNKEDIDAHPTDTSHRRWDLFKWLAEKVGNQKKKRDIDGYPTDIIGGQEGTADVHVRSNSGDTTLKYSKNSGRPDMIKLIHDQKKKTDIAALTDIIRGRKGSDIINQVIKGRSQFSHHTLAEYFMATFIINTLLTRVDQYSHARKLVFTQILLDVNNQYKATRVFLNNLLPDEPAWPNAFVRKVWKADLEACHYPRDEPDQNYDTIFHKVTTEDHFKIVKLFLNLFDHHDQRRKYWIHVRNQKFGRTLLHIAAENQHWDALKWLIETEGVDVDSRCDDKRTSLHTAAFFGNLDMVKWLVNKRACVDALDWIKRTPLYEAAKRGNFSVIKWLVEEKQASLKATNDKGRTVLHVAASHRHWDLLKWLAKKEGADVNAKDNKGTTVLLIAAVFWEWDIVKHLVISCNADVHVKSNSGVTAVKYAEKFGCRDIIKLLRNPTDVIRGQKETGIID